MLVTRNVATREEIIAGIQELAARLERRPTQGELCAELKIDPRRVKKLFGAYARALQASGLTPNPNVRRTLSLEELLDDWRTVARKLGKIPTIPEYEIESKYSVRPLSQRFGGWRGVPAGLLEFGDQRELWAGWEDVRELAQQCLEEKTMCITDRRKSSISEPVDARMVYGEPLTDSPMATAPTNEMGVVVLFGILAQRLGFVILKMQKYFPDCEALRRLDGYRWQRLRIEFEFESRNFFDHGHDPQGCDLIVCWKHTWEECAIPVLELCKVLKNGGGRAAL